MSKLDFSNIPIVDNHCHGLSKARMLAQTDPAWFDRLTIMGMCCNSAEGLGPDVVRSVSRMTENTVFATLSRRLLAEYLNCSADDIGCVRRHALHNDMQRYLSGMLAHQNVSALLVDDGYPPDVDQAEMQSLFDVPVYRVARNEPMIDRARNSTDKLSDLEASLRAQLQAACNDAKCVAFKSVIAYRTGLDIGYPTFDEAASSYQKYRNSDWRDGRDTSKDVRDYLFNTVMEVAKQHSRPVHIHSGGGDPDVVFPHVNPILLGPFLKRHCNHPVVLIHSGYPWIEEAAYLGAIFPNVYLDLSIYLTWSTLDIDRALNIAIGTVPTNKLFYGSDQASEPELLWICAKLARAALQRVLESAIANDYITLSEAPTIARNILSANTLRLHGIIDDL